MADTRFGPFALDMGSCTLFRNGREVRLRLQAVQALAVLVLRAGRHVGYDELLAEAWRGVVVSRHTVDVTLAEIRKSLGEYGSWLRHDSTLGYILDVPRSSEQVRIGWHLWSLRTRPGFEGALRSFEQAAETEPDDFRAHAGRAACLMLMGAYGMRPGREVLPLFLAAHARAEALAGRLPELRCLRAQALHMFERRLEEAEAEFRHALGEKPTLALAHVGLTTLYATWKRLDDALVSSDAANAIDSLHPVVPAMAVAVRLWRREFALAVALGEAAVELQPYVVLGRVFYGEALDAAGRTSDALAQFQFAASLFRDLPWLRTAEGACLARAGRRAEAHSVLEELEARRATDYVDAYAMAILKQTLGDVDGAFAELDRAVDENSASLFAIGVDPKADPLRRDRRFGRLRAPLRPGRPAPGQ
jgi:tetratricopeptide (TPR) repeat protein